MRYKGLFLVLAILMIVSLTACSVRGAHNGGAISAPEAETDGETLSGADTKDIADDQQNDEWVEPYASYLPFFFADEAELIDAVRSDAQNTATISSLTEYYRPKSIPSDTSLSRIMVKDFYVALRYDYNDTATEANDSDPYFLFEWYRTKKEGDTEANIYRTYSPDKVETFKYYYLLKGSTLQDIFWEENGLAFHAVTPSSISTDQLEEFCAAEKVIIERGSQEQPAVITMDANQTQGTQFDLGCDLPTEATDPAAWSLEKEIQLISAFDDTVSLYGCYFDGETSVLITWDGIKETFQWHYLTPHGFALRADWFDIDHDGEKELIATILFGTGTGVSVSELHIVKPDASGTQLVDYAVPSELYAQALKLLSVDIGDGSIKLSAGTQELIVARDDASAFQSKICQASIVRFDVSEAQVSVSYGIGLPRTEVLVENIAFLSAALDFSNGVYTLSSFAVTEG